MISTPMKERGVFSLIKPNSGFQRNESICTQKSLYYNYFYAKRISSSPDF